MSRIEDLKDLRGKSLWEKFINLPVFTRAVYVSLAGTATVGLTTRFIFKAKKTTVVHCVGVSYTVLTLGCWYSFMYYDKHIKTKEKLD